MSYLTAGRAVFSLYSAKQTRRHEIILMTRPHGFVFVVYGTTTRGIFPQGLIGCRKVVKRKKERIAAGKNDEGANAATALRGSR